MVGRYEGWDVRIDSHFVDLFTPSTLIESVSLLRDGWILFLSCVYVGSMWKCKIGILESLL